MLCYSTMDHVTHALPPPGRLVPGALQAQDPRVPWHWLGGLGGLMGYTSMNGFRAPLLP